MNKTWKKTKLVIFGENELEIFISTILFSPGEDCNAYTGFCNSVSCTL